MQVKCLDAVIDGKKKKQTTFIVVEVLPHITSSTGGKKKNKRNCKYHNVLVLSEDISWYRVVYQGTQR